MKTLAPLLAAWTAIFAFGAAQSAADSQEQNFKDQTLYFQQSIANLDAQLKQRNEQFQKEIALQIEELYGDLQFQALRYDDWRIVLEKLDGKHFTLHDFIIEATVQRSASEPPTILKTPTLDVARWYEPQHHQVTIPDLRSLVWRSRPDVCQNAEIQRVYLRFLYRDKPYRVRVFPADAS